MTCEPLQKKKPAVVESDSELEEVVVKKKVTKAVVSFWLSLPRLVPCSSMSNCRRSLFFKILTLTPRKSPKKWSRRLWFP